MSSLPIPSIPFELVLWDAEDIAGYLRRDSVRTVRERLMHEPDFPKPVRLPTQKGKGHPLYKAIEVVQYVEKFKEKAA